MRHNTFPPGRDKERVAKVLKHYESQTEEEAVAEDESAFEIGKRSPGKGARLNYGAGKGAGKRSQAQLWRAQMNEIAQPARRADAKLRLALRAWPQFGAGCA